MIDKSNANNTDYKTTFQVMSASFDISSNISAAAYDPFMETLTITFRNGGIYDYIQVKEDIFNKMVDSVSAGKFFHAQIKSKYEFLRRK